MLLVGMVTKKPHTTRSSPEFFKSFNEEQKEKIKVYSPKVWPYICLIILVSFAGGSVNFVMYLDSKCIIFGHILLNTAGNKLWTYKSLLDR